MKKTIVNLLAIAIAALVSAQAHAAISALYTFDGGGGSLASSDSDPNSTAGNWTKAVGFGPGTGLNHIGGTSYDYMFAGGMADIGVANEATAISDNRSISFLVTFATAVNLSSLQFDIATGTSGQAVNWAVLSSLTGGLNASDNIATGSTTSTTLTTISPINFSGSPYDGVSSVTFYLVLWNGGGANMPNGFVDNVQLSSVPEPITYSLAVFGLVFIGGGVGRFYLGRCRSAKVS